MALKDWEKIKSTDPDRVFEAENKKKNLWIWVAKRYNGEFIVGIKNEENIYFKSKSKAMAFARSYMRTH